MVNKSTAYPPEYNPRVHGPYKPWVYYGKADTPLSKVALGDLSGWLMRRNLYPIAISQAVSRGYWRYLCRDGIRKFSTARTLYSLSMIGMAYIFFIDWAHVKEEAKHKYH